MKKSILCMAGAYPSLTGNYQFNIVHTHALGWFIWEEGSYIPDEFAAADGHVYELIWDDERVEARLREINHRILLIPRAIPAISIFIVTNTESCFYTLRDRLREIGEDPSRSDWEKIVRAAAPYLTIG